MSTEEMIAELASRLRPVRRLPRPGAQAAEWLAMAVAAVVLVLLVTGFRGDLAAHLGRGFEVAQWVLSVLVGLTAALAAAMLARPDRSWRWGLLPLPFALAWVASIGWGCLGDMARDGMAGLNPGTSWPCVIFVLLLGVPLTAIQLVLLRHAGPVRPEPVIALAGLASAALCSAGISLFHPTDAAAELLVWHGGAVLVLLGLGRVFGPALLLRPPR